MKATLQKIDQVLKWEPPDLFGKEHLGDYRKYDTPRVEGDLFGITTSHGYFEHNYTFTKLGAALDRFPILLEMLIKFVYYVVAWPVYLLVKFPWALFRDLCLPRNWFD
jgi:hypothetical protein